MAANCPHRPQTGRRSDLHRLTRRALLSASRSLLLTHAAHERTQTAMRDLMPAHLKAAATPAVAAPAAPAHVPRLVDNAFSVSNRLIISADVEVLLENGPIKLEAPLAGVPLEGQWKVAVEYEGAGQSLTARIEHGAVPVGAFGSQVSVFIRIGWLDGGKVVNLKGSTVPSGPAPAPKPASPHSASTGWAITASSARLSEHPKERSSSHRRPITYRISVELNRDEATQRIPERLLAFSQGALMVTPRGTALLTA